MGVSHSQTDLPTLNSGSSSIEGLNTANAKEYKQELNQWILRAYEGDRDAQFKVGVLLSNNQLETPDYEQAVYWYKQAALQGHALAQYNLGHQHLAGLGVERSESQAMEWWLKAAEQNHALAQFNVGRGYYLGIGLSENHKKSRAWFERAAQNGEPKSIEILKQITWSDDTATSSDTIAKTNSSNASQSQSIADTPATANVAEEEPIALKSVISDQLPEEESQTNTLSGSITQPTSELKPEPELASASLEPVSSSTIVPVETPVVLVETLDTSNAVAQNIRLFTNPKINDRLIAFVNLDGKVTIEEQSDKWTSISHSKGFPIWVHGDFVSTNNSTGKITGSNVNARSQPKITDGSIVGRLNKGETLTVLQKNDEWYQLTSPSRFIAWVKTAELGALSKAPESKSATSSTTNATKANDNAAAKEPTAKASSRQTLSGADSNEWLFKQAPGAYTLQLATFSVEDNATRFLEERNINTDPNLRAFASKKNNWTYYLYGSYASRSDARKAKQGLKLPKAWVRTFEELQQNRCVTWKTQLPTPEELTTYCVN